eukprot:2127772-Rhodomonas_salina.3
MALCREPKAGGRWCAVPGRTTLVLGLLGGQDQKLCSLFSRISGQLSGNAGPGLCRHLASSSLYRDMIAGDQISFILCCWP